MKKILSNREVEILQLIVSEYTTSEIADKLHLSRETVKAHRKNLRNKFEVRNVAGLIRRASEYQVFPH